MDPTTQLWGAIEAVWRSWTLKKAVDYRRVNAISETLGTGVNVVSMVFGNLGDDSGTGVAFTRNPSTGEKKFYGEFLINAQGEDVVAGIRTPLSIDEMGAQSARGVRGAARDRRSGSSSTSATCRTSSSPSNAGKLYLLQTRTGKRTAAAAVRIATDMVDEGLIDTRTAVLRVDARAARSAAASGDRRRTCARRRSAPDFPRAPARRAASPCSIPTSPSSAPRPAST